MTIYISSYEYYCTVFFEVVHIHLGPVSNTWCWCFCVWYLQQHAAKIHSTTADIMLRAADSFGSLEMSVAIPAIQTIFNSNILDWDVLNWININPPSTTHRTIGFPDISTEDPGTAGLLRPRAPRDLITAVAMPESLPLPTWQSCGGCGIRL